MSIPLRTTVSASVDVACRNCYRPRSLPRLTLHVDIVTDQLSLPQEKTNPFFPCRTQWTQDLDHRSGPSQEIRSEENPQGHQEEVWYVTTEFPKARDYRTGVLTARSWVTACNGTIVTDTEMGEVIQLQGDQRKDVQEFLVDKKEGLELDTKTIKVHGF
ncbi:MAG: Eukaryotic translation initiation factor eIF-1 [Sclerophora amabilis]|nr:MAG: Eukaryotic translation initiation factor eIF-1 [Sclerophora amabilis]